ncbi:MAG TPA: hypothetical protein PKY86_05345 [Niabella sp.]|nr:hypothetical protein [Niabella sp.]HQX21427.1 hypothetical protein [Niabella sp.]HQX73460.1 hypothetical protein [Chitinophagaceae bacterium]HRB36131.1 hypothetical protein [Niabella sp.]HRB79612.1 hypothetical protein [Niabella sp.]
MTPISFDTEWLLDLAFTDNNELWKKVRKYLRNKTFEVPYTPSIGMSISLSSFLDDSFSELESDEVASYNIIVDDIYMRLDCLIIFAEGVRLLPERGVPNSSDN